MLAHNTFHPRITHHLSNTNPSIWILIQALINKCCQLNTNKIIIIDNFYILDIQFQLSFILTTPWEGTMQELIAHNTYRPYITFLAVNIGDQGLWGHVDWSTDIIVISRILGEFFYHAKICNFNLISFDKNIRGFKISMNKPRLQETLITSINLPKNRFKIILRKSTFQSQIFLQITTLTIFRNNIAIVNSLIRIEIFQQIVMINFLHTLQLYLKKISFCRVIYRF